MIVMKFGGTSVGSPERIDQVFRIVQSQHEHQPLVVTSAVGGITDLLVNAGKQALLGKVSIEAIRDKHIQVLQGLGLPAHMLDAELKELHQLLTGIRMIGEISPRTSDLLLSFGERMSCQILAAHFTNKGIAAKHHFAYDIGMITNDHFMQAEPLAEAYTWISNHLSQVDYVPVITGFIGKTIDGVISTLGRGGSDYTAAIIGAAIQAQEIQIWTDVDGILTTDPRIVHTAMNVPEVSFKEAAELAYFGAKVLHPKTIRPAMDQQIPVVVRNTANIDHPGTRILPNVPQSQQRVKAISVKKNISLINIYSFRMLNAFGFLSRIFNIFEKFQIVVDVVSTSEVSVSVTVENGVELDPLVKELSGFAQVKVETNKSIICIVGEGLNNDVSIPGKVFQAISDAGIYVNMISQGASDINLSFVIDNQHAERAVATLHQVFFG